VGNWGFKAPHCSSAYPTPEFRVVVEEGALVLLVLREGKGKGEEKKLWE
jgi:hypothetical protein